MPIRAAAALVSVLATFSLVLAACSTSATPARSRAASSAKSATATPSPQPGNVVVSIAPTIRSDPRSSAVAALLTRRYLDVNERNFDDYWTQYTPTYLAKFDRSQTEAGYRSTEISDVQLTDLSTGADGRIAIKVTFNSTQDAADAANGQNCTKWMVGFFLQQAGTAYLLDTPPASYHAEHIAC